MRSEAVAAAATDVHAVSVKVHLAIVWQRLGRRYGRVEGRAWWRVVVSGVQRRSHGSTVEEVGVGGALGHHGRADGREAAEGVLVGAGGVQDGVFGEGEVGGVDGEGDLGLRGIERGRLQRRVVEGVVVDAFVVGVVVHGGAVHGRDLGRGFCTPLGRLIRVMLAGWSQHMGRDKDSLVARR